jgi:hypothetical protein
MLVSQFLAKYLSHVLTDGANRSVNIGLDWAEYMALSGNKNRVGAMPALYQLQKAVQFPKQYPHTREQLQNLADQISPAFSMTCEISNMIDTVAVAARN